MDVSRQNNRDEPKWLRDCVAQIGLCFGFRKSASSVCAQQIARATQTETQVANLSSASTMLPGYTQQQELSEFSRLSAEQSSSLIKLPTPSAPEPSQSSDQVVNHRQRNTL